MVVPHRGAPTRAAALRLRPRGRPGPSPAGGVRFEAELWVFGAGFGLLMGWFHPFGPSFGGEEGYLLLELVEFGL
jgi:hypothetical protein